MIICVDKEILYPDTTWLPKVILLATYYQAIDYTRCCEQFYNFYLSINTRAIIAKTNSVIRIYEIGLPKFNVQPREGNLL